MFKNYLKVASRNFRKKPVNSFVIVTGLVVSLAFCLLMLIYVDSALRWDRTHPESSRLHLVAMDSFEADDVSTDFSLFDFSEKQIYRSPMISYIHSRHFQENIPELSESVLFFSPGKRRSTDVRIGNDIFPIAISSADIGFLDFVSHDVISGNAKRSEADPASIIVSSDFARRHFGNDRVIGESIYVVFDEKPEPFLIGAVVEFPEKSSIKFEVLMNMESNKSITKNLYEIQANSRFQLLARLPESVDLPKLERKIQASFEQHFGDFIESRRNFVNIRSDSPIRSVKLIAVEDIHLEPLLDWAGKANLQHILLVGLFAVVLLLVSGINYFLISLAVLSSRLSEIGLRRVIGAQKKHVILQFWIENCLVILFSLLIAICLLQLALPTIRDEMGIFIHGSQLFLLKSGVFLGTVLVLLSLVISLFPTLMVYRVKVSESAKGNKTYKVNTRFVNWLVAVQFIICFCFISSGLLMNGQLKFVLSRDLGFDQEQIVQVATGDALFKRALESHTEIASVARGGGWGFGHTRMGFVSKMDSVNLNLMQLEAEPELLDLLGLKINWLNNDFGDRPVAIINKELAGRMGMDKLEQKTVGFRQQIVGIVEGLQVAPFTAEDDYFFINPNSDQHMLWQTFIKVQPGQLEEGMRKIEKVWFELFPNKSFEYVFLDDHIAQNYDSYKETSSLINFITLLGIAIAALGLFALNGIIVQNRMKEIGIRKVLGATVRQVMLLVNLRVFLIVLVAGLISIPLSYVIISDWLENFTISINLNWSYFVLTLLIGLLVSVLVVSAQTVRAIRVDPVQLLKDE